MHSLKVKTGTHFFSFSPMPMQCFVRKWQGGGGVHYIGLLELVKKFLTTSYSLTTPQLLYSLMIIKFHHKRTCETPAALNGGHNSNSY